MKSIRTFKIATPTTTNYAVKIGGLFFAVRKNSRGYWMAVSYKANLLSTDNYEVKILDGYETKKDALKALVKRVSESPKSFYHIYPA